MEQYISKAALVAEIEGRLSLLEGSTGHPEVVKRVEGVIKAYKSILSFLDTLEAKEVKEVDFEQEYDRYCENLCVIDIDEPFIEMYGCAKHFFELGMAVGNKTQKGE